MKGYQMSNEYTEALAYWDIDNVNCAIDCATDLPETIRKSLKIAEALEGEVSDAMVWCGSEEILNPVNTAKGSLRVAREAFKAMAQQMIREIEDV